MSVVARLASWGVAVSLAAAAPATAQVTRLALDSANGSVGSMSLTTRFLDQLNELVPGGNLYTYAAAIFVPTATRTYALGVSRAPFDTVMFLADRRFDPAAPGRGALVLNDDRGRDIHRAALGDPTAVISCNGQNAFCSQVTQALVAGRKYSLVVTTWQPTPAVTLPIDLYADGPGMLLPLILLDPEATLVAMARNAAGLRGALSLRGSQVAQALEADCRDIGANGLCFSIGGQYGQGGDANEFAGVVMAAYQPVPGLRIGGVINQGAGLNLPGSSGVNLRGPSQVFGAFLVAEASPDHTGLRFRASVAGHGGNARITRDGSAPGTEPGSGTAGIRGIGYGMELSYGFAVQEGWHLAPFAGLRRVESRRVAYTEADSADVTAPISYDAYRQRATTANVGIRAFGMLTENLGLTLSAGLDRDMNRRTDSYGGTSEIPSLETFQFQAGGQPNHIRPTAGMSLRYTIDEGQGVGFDTVLRRASYGSDYGTISTVRYILNF